MSFTYFGDGLQSGVLTCLQYLDGADIPTGEFIIEAFGSWPNLSTRLTNTSSGGTAPDLVMMSGFMRTTGGAGPYRFFDFDGTLVRESSPPTPGNPFLLQHANIVGCLKGSSSSANRYYVSGDEGQTWTELSIGGGTPPAGFVLHVTEAGTLPFTSTIFDPRQVSSWQPLFIT